MGRSIKSLFSASASMRMFMFNSSLLMLVGIWLTGFDKVHWFIYFVPAFYLFAAVTGFCLGLVIPRLIFDKN
jgi:hypothetical protein